MTMMEIYQAVLMDVVLSWMIQVHFWQVYLIWTVISDLHTLYSFLPLWQHLHHLSHYLGSEPWTILIHSPTALTLGWWIYTFSTWSFILQWVNKDDYQSSCSWSKNPSWKSLQDAKSCNSIQIMDLFCCTVQICQVWDSKTKNMCMVGSSIPAKLNNLAIVAI